MSSDPQSSARLFYIAIFYRRPDAGAEEEKKAGTSIRLAQVTNFSGFSFFVRSTAGDAIRFAARTVVNRIPSGHRHSVSSGDPKAPFVVHSYVRPDGVACAIVTDEHYDKRVAFVLISKQLTKFDKENNPSNYQNLLKDLDAQPEFMKNDLQNYRDPKSADLLTKIHSQVQDVKGVVQQSINQVLANGETIDGLVDKSDDLDKQSKQFLKQSKKANSCCKFGF